MRELHDRAVCQDWAEPPRIKAETVFDDDHRGGTGNCPRRLRQYGRERLSLAAFIGDGRHIELRIRLGKRAAGRDHNAKYHDQCAGDCQNIVQITCVHRSSFVDAAQPMPRKCL